MINPTSHISFHVSAPSLLYRLILKWSDNSTLKYLQIKTAGMCKQRKYTPKSINQIGCLTLLLKLCWPCNIGRLFRVVEPLSFFFFADSTLGLSQPDYSLLMIFATLCALVLEKQLFINHTWIYCSVGPKEALFRWYNCSYVQANKCLSSLYINWKCSSITL